MRRPWARSATIEPILPQPMMPRVLLVISTPMKRFFSHLPAWVETSACGICRASASMSETACSAVVIELPNGVFITMMPLAVAAGISTLSTPMPARPITFSPFALSRILDVTLVAERTASPSKSPIAAASFSLSAPSFGWKSTSTPRSRKICTAAGERASEMRTRGVMASRRLQQRVLASGKRPVEPERERLDIGALDGRAAPDAQAGRCVAVGIDVVGDAFLLQRGGHALDERGLRLGRKPADRGVDHLQADRGVGAD